ncbi:D-3-phosphoglycerate dehydrogenase [Oceanotoga teriensis]|uniref:D-3-phosphoglycerate dehydrogenase n=1 Tax=Oceanotoga teriensis TaxID=515440 RepID=A0AA45HIE1_9BACT|nr:NAD(P)-dependent oxidoreductase [Oceanotoga teriensis]PWJ91226.1 D-3-phosphoglycerate dehydrogenase [Oceanotoga teriensis]
MRIHLNDGMAESAIKKFNDELPEFTITNNHLEPEELKNEVKNIDILVVRSATKVTRGIIEAGKDSLKIIGRAGMGLDNIDQVAAKEFGIEVLNTPGQNSLSVAELVVGMILSIYRKLNRGTNGIREGLWEKKLLKGLELSNKNFGIIGFGNIGKHLSKLVSGFNDKVFVYDIYEISEEDKDNYNIEQVDLDYILKNCDIISLHIPHNEKTHHLISDKELNMMKKSALLINCARGGVLDEEALLKALEDEKILGAGLDVFEKEPAKGEIYTKLLSFDNVVATPHIGATTKEAQYRVGINMVERIVNATKKIHFEK